MCVLLGGGGGDGGEMGERWGGGKMETITISFENSYSRLPCLS